MNIRYATPVLASVLTLACRPGEPEQRSQPETSPQPQAASPQLAPEGEASDEAEVPRTPEPASTPPAAELDNLDTGISVFANRSIESTGDSVTHWRVNAKKGQLAARFSEGCGVWSIASGEYQGLAAVDTKRDPCKAWSKLRALEWSRGTATVKAPSGGSSLSLQPERFELAGTALSGEAPAGERYLGASFDPKGERLAILVAAGPESRLQLWSVADAKLLRELAFPHPMSDWGGDARNAVGAWLRWTEAALSLAVEVELDFGDSQERFAFLHVLSDPMGAARSAQIAGMNDGGESLEKLYVDRERSLLVALLEGTIPDHGGSYNAAAIASVETGEVYDWDTIEYLEKERRSPDHEWSDAVGVSAWDLQEADEGYYEDMGWGWSVRSITALPEGKVELSETGGNVWIKEVGGDMRLALVGRGEAVSERLLCPADTSEGADLDAIPACPERSALPTDCALVDASWDMKQLLLACGDRWLAMPAPEFGAAIELDNRGVVLARGAEEPRVAMWGPTQLMLWTEAAGLRVVDIEGGAAKLRALEGVDELIRARLDEELERALVRVKGALRVVDLAELSGEGDAGLGAVLGWSGAIEHAAFAPDGQRIALAGSGELAVFALDQAAALATWRSESVEGIAFRQDGAVLYLGEQRAIPELAFDPATGKPLPEAQLDARVLARLADAGMDPSWRWAIDVNGALIRALDGRSLVRAEPGRVLAGSTKDFHAFAMREGPPGSEVKAATELPSELAREDLLERFMTGQALR